MNFRRISILLLLLVAGAGTIHAQEGTIQPAEPVPGESQPVVEAPEQPAPTDTAADLVGEDAPVTGAQPAADPSPAPEITGPQSSPALQPVPSGANGATVVNPADDERMRSIFIIASAVVLVGALGAIIFLLVKRGREASRAKGRYVAEAYLRDLSGSTTEAMYKLGSKPVMLGRVGGKDTEFLDYIVVPSATVGRRHALIEFKDFGYWIMDQGSINGTFVNNRPVSSEVRLKHGDRIRLHKLEFEFVMPEVSESSVTVLAQDANRTPSGASVAPEAELELEPEPDIAPASAGDDIDEVLESPESEEETLLPGASVSPGRQGSNEETLLPAGGSAPPGAEETLLPASGSQARAKSPAKPKPDDGDEFFDITRGT